MIEKEKRREGVTRLGREMEGWLSGRKRRSRKAIDLKGSRGFKSHSFRKFEVSVDDLIK